uniref:Uncharacterized protein n=1 Tax=Tanacetum cinerariifolium TaxID=118510 RepID=A0A6L2KLX3_TANCI|nr:hypothetical protein [Tanacetum cinerariifolium]
MVFHKMNTEEVSDRFVAPCFVNELEAFDGEINLEVEENMISNKYAVKLCQEHEVKRGNKVGDFRKIIPTYNQITDFEDGTVTIYPELDPFLDKYEKTKKSMDDWDQLLVFNLDDIPLLGGEELLLFEAFTQEEAAKEALAIRISQRFALLKEVKGEALKEKDNPEAFIFPIRLEGKVNINALADTGSDINTIPYRIYETLGREEMKKVDRGLTMINHTQAEAMGILTNVGVTTLIAKFLILDMPIDRVAPIMVGRGFLCTIGGIVNTPERLFSTFDGICHQTFHAARSDVLRTVERGNNDEAGPSRSKRSRQFETVEKVFLLQVHHVFLLWEGCNRDAKFRYNTKLAQFLPRHIYSSCVVNWDVLNKMGCDGEIDEMLRIKLRAAGSNKEIFTSVAWIKAFNINEPIYSKLFHEFYSTCEYDEVCANDELQTKIIKFKLGGHAHNFTLLEFARRLGLYHADELDEEGFDVYFEEGLRSDEHFNAHEYWLSISREENLSLSRSHASTIRSLVLRVIHKMITYSLCQRTIGYDKIQKNDLWLLSMFDARHQNGYANVAWLIVRSMSASIYCKDLDTTMLKELIDSKGRLIPEDPQQGVPRVGIPRPPKALMQALYDRMCRMEIREEAIERMEYRQSYLWDMYQRVFEHMAGVYSVPLQGVYNPPGYAQPQYD